MSKVHGKLGGLMWADGSTTKRNISEFLTSIDFPRTADTAEVTTFNSTQDAKAYVAGLQDRTFSFEGKFDPVVDGYLDGAHNKSKPFTYYINSTSTGANFVRYSGNEILTGYDIATSIDDAVTFSCEAQCSGAVTRSTASS